MSEKFGFFEAVIEAYNTPSLVAEWERLYGMKLVSDYRPPRNAIEAMVDRATGYQPTPNEEAMRAFVKFVWDAIWTRLPDEAFEK